MTVAIRRATRDDLDFLVELLTHEEVDPFLAASRDADRENARGRDRALRARAGGVRPDDRRGRRRACRRDAYERSNNRSRIARLGGLAIHPRFRGRRAADEAARLLQRLLFDELGFHRLELEIYGFNERAIAHAERSGFVREGVKRRAYWRDGEWVDGVLFGLVVEDGDD